VKSKENVGLYSAMDSHDRERLLQVIAYTCALKCEEFQDFMFLLEATEMKEYQ
jgi:hypothetical protein